MLTEVSHITIEVLRVKGVEPYLSTTETVKLLQDKYYNRNRLISDPNMIEDLGRERKGKRGYKFCLQKVLEIKINKIDRRQRTA